MNNYILKLYILMLLVFNRALTKLSIFGVDVSSYLLTYFTLIMLLSKGARSLLKYRWVLITLCFAVLQLFVSLYSDNDLIMSLRRSMVLIYLLIPIILLELNMRLRLSQANILFILVSAALFSVVASTFETNFRTSLLATIGGFIVALLVTHRSSFYKLTIPILLYGYFVAYPTFFAEGGFYRTPLLSLSLFLFIHYSSIALRDLGKFRFKKSYLQNVFIFLVFTPILIQIPIIQKLIYEVLMGANGLFGIDLFAQLAHELGQEGSRGSRGNAFNTVNDRVSWWIAIIENGTQNWTTFLLGAGIQDSFFNILFPNQTFTDQDVLTPHNSIVLIFFQYGFLGVALFLLSVLEILKKNDFSCSDTPFLAFAFAYISFEVALESPHGAVLFWLFMLNRRVISLR